MFVDTPSSKVCVGVLPKRFCLNAANLVCSRIRHRHQPGIAERMVQPLEMQCCRTPHLDRAMKTSQMPLARANQHSSLMIYVFHCEIELIFMMLSLPQNSVPRSVRMRSSGTPSSSRKGRTRSFSISAATSAFLRS